MNIRMASVCLAVVLAGGDCGFVGRRQAACGEPDNRDLIAYWTFDEGSGAVAKDVTGHGHDAALKNVDWAASPRGHALRFDSKEDLAQYGQVDSMNVTGDVTLAVWVKTDSSVEPGTNRLIFGDGGAGIERNLNLRMDGYGYLRFEWADGKTSASLLAPSTLMNGTWKHVVVVANSQGELATMYVDGVEVARMDMPLPVSRAPVRERLTGWFYNGCFQGELDDVRLYGRALSAAEVEQLFESEVEVQVGEPTVLFDASQPEPRGVASVKLRNGSKELRRVEVSGPNMERQDVRLEPGAEAEVSLAPIALKPVWRSRSDLFLCEPSPETGRISVVVHRGEQTEQMSLGLTSQLALEPLRVEVEDPWQRRLPAGRTKRLTADLQFALPAEQLRQGTLQVCLVSCETKQEVLRRQVNAPSRSMPLALDVSALPWGAYDLRVSFQDRAGRAVVSTERATTILPEGRQAIRVLNNLVSELMDARARGLLRSPRIEFMNPREGWVWFRASGDCALRLAGKEVLAAAKGTPGAETMRLLPAGKHVLQVTGTPTDVTVRAVPALVYNVYPSTPQIAPFGSNTWERLRKYTLPNTNTIEGQVVDTPEHAEWLAQGKSWLGNVQAPGLIDKQEWTVDRMLEVWRKPGTSTAHPERPGFDLAKLSGLQVDEYYSGMSAQHVLTTALSIAQLAEDLAFAGKLWIPFVVNMFGNPTAELFMKTSLGAGWPYSVEVYVGEMPTEAENATSLRSRFRGVAAGWEGAYPGSLRHAIFTPMYAYLPYCTTNRYPQADFRVHLDMQMEVLANDPAFFGLWGVQPYRSNYVDEEILNCMGRLLRHYCIEGKTTRLLTDPYELRHVTDPDFEEGTKHWQAVAAKEGSLTAGEFAGYGQLQGRYPGGAFGDTFAVMTRSAKAPNVLRQQLQKLQQGRRYSVKLLTGDSADLQAGKTRKDQQAVSVTVTGAEVLEGGFSYPFRSARGPKPFTAEHPFWMTYHYLRFRADGPTATLSISDWAKPNEPGGPPGQQVMCSFVEVQPVLENGVE